ncbi:phage integrase N-terminal SAM-like domain-containing protein [uncultured Desulfovibrio sp.]|uniref:phage integrase N-terminal SAM-like domain-containing protein n=1 Tax=uncultured Desulfovibrio sp. TaxID=167968 RepID=UPI0026103C0F|nr:phage integrase N-terminal SAM-like domain-containing protein [uncultured Desulfovibrio sp.]
MPFESLYLLYLKEKQFDRKSLLWQMDCIRPALKKFGAKAVSEIKKDEITEVMEVMKQTGVKPVTVKKRMSALKTVFRWIAGNGYGPDARLPEAPFRAVKIHTALTGGTCSNHRPLPRITLQG